MRNSLFALIFILSLATAPVRAVGAAQSGAVSCGMRSTSALRDQPRYTASPGTYSPAFPAGIGFRPVTSGRRLRTATTGTLHSYSGTGVASVSGFSAGRGSMVRPASAVQWPATLSSGQVLRPVLPGSALSAPVEAGVVEAPMPLFNGRNRTVSHAFRHGRTAGGTVSRRYTPPTAANAWLDKYRNFFGEDPADEEALEAFKQWYMGSGLYGGDDDDDDDTGSGISSIYQQWVLRFYNYYGRYPNDDAELDEFIRWWQGGGIYTPGDLPLGDGLLPLLLLAMLAAAFLRRRNNRKRGNPAAAVSQSIIEQKKS